MHDGVCPGLDEDEVPDDLVQVDVVVQWEDGGHAQLTHDRDRVAQHQHQDQARRVVQTAA